MVPARAIEIVVGDDPAAWARLGFTLGASGAARIGDVELVAAGRDGGAGLRRLAVSGMTDGTRAPDGLPIEPVLEPGPRPEAPAHSNGAVRVDHVVAFTDDMDRTLAALDSAGIALRRLREPPEAPARQAFLRLGAVILELVETGDAAPAFWGLVVTVSDLDAAAASLGELIGTPRDAVQPGRRIATVRRGAGLSVALALMSP